MSPVVDILMPTYKPNASYVQEALDSIFAQTEQNWHLHIQDEPTEVDTKSIVKKYLDDDRVSFAQNTKRLGIGGNWNACLQHTKSPYVQYMFQDDLWNPTLLENGVQIFNHHPEVGMVSFGHTYRMEGNGPHSSIYKEVQDAIAKIPEGKKGGMPFLLWWMKIGLRPNIIGEPCFVMLRKNVMDTVGQFDENMQQSLDAEYWVRMLSKADWYHAKGNFGSFRVHSNAATAQNAMKRVGMFDRCIIFGRAMHLVPLRKKPEALVLFGLHFIKMVLKFVSRTCQP